MKKKHQKLLEEGKNRFLSGDYEEALERYSLIFKDCPDHPDALFEAGKACYARKLYPEAGQYLERAEKLNPGNVALLELLAKVYQEEKLYQEAAGILQRLLLSSPSALRHYELGLLYERTGRYNEAAGELTKACGMGMGTAEMHHELGRIYWILGDGMKALGEFRKAGGKGEGSSVCLSLGLPAAGDHSELDEFLDTLRYGPDRGEVILDVGPKRGRKKTFQKDFSRTGDPFEVNRELNNREMKEGQSYLESKPRGLLVTLTHRCNLRCFMCNIGKPEWDMKKKTVAEIVRWLPYLQEIRWQGGEVFLSDFFEELYAEASRYPRISHSFITNGLLLDGKWAERFSNGNVDLITFSIDGVTKDVYEKIRAGGSFAKLLENLGILNERRSRKPGNLKTMLNAVIMESNYRQVLDFVEFASEYGFQYLQLSSIEDVTGPENIFLCRNGRALEFLRKKMPEVIRRSEEKKLVLRNCLPLPVEGGEKKRKIDKGHPSPGAKQELLCLLPWQYLSINYGGSVAPHCSCRKKTGSVDEYSLKELWNNEMMQLYRKMIFEGKAHLLCNQQCFNDIVPPEYRRIG